MKKQPQQKRMSNRERLKELQSFVQLCFAMLPEKLTDEQIAVKAGLCTTTVWRLRDGQASKYTRFWTIQALGMAAGLRLEMNKYKATVRLARVG